MVYTKRLNLFVVGILLGIFSAKFFPVSLFLVIASSFLLLLVSFSKRRLFGLFFLSLGVVVGMARSAPIIDGYSKLSSDVGQKVEFDATVITDPVYHKSGQLEYNANNLRYRGKNVNAVVRIRSFTNALKRGDRIRVKGKLRDGFAYWQASLYFANVKVLSSDASNLSKVRAKFIANIYSVLPDPEASLGLGFLIGVRSLLPSSLNNQLTITGLTHIVAVSGYNLTILADVSRRFFYRFSRFQAMAVTFALLLLFVSVTGVSPSIVRAVVVSVLSIGTWYYGRTISAWTLLLFSSSLSAFYEPSFAWSNIGWYLSLAAFFGVLVIAPLLQAKLSKNKKPNLLLSVFFETTSAQLFTLPIIMLVFGKVSLIALLANIIVLPLIPLAMLLTFMLGASVFISNVISSIIIIPTYLVLRFITNIIRILSSFNWSLLEVSVTKYQMIGQYILLLILWLVLRRAKQSDIIEIDSTDDKILGGNQNYVGTFKMGKN